MRTFTVSKNLLKLDLDTLMRILQQFQSSNVGVLKKNRNYYLGKQQILFKKPSDTGKPCNAIVVNFCKNIVDTYSGYAVGIPPTYSSDTDIEDIQNVLNYNDVNQVDSEYFKDALMYGIAAEICYIDEEGQIRFKSLDPTGIIPVYSDTLDHELKFAVRFWEAPIVNEQTPHYYVEVYDNTYKTLYKSTAGFTSFEFLNETPHFFNQVPVTFFDLNKENNAIAEPIYGLQDAYNSLFSGSVDDWDSFCDAYMIIKGCNATDEELADMKQHRVLLLDNDSDASFLTKNISDTQIQNLLNLCETKIREIAACPNFASESFGTSSGIAIQYRCMNMENAITSILNYFKKALQKRIELICSILNLKGGEQVWRDIDIKFHRNFPEDLTSLASCLNSYRGLVSTETLLAQIPFVKDVDEELAKIAEEQNRQLELYAMNIPAEEEDNGEEDSEQLLG